MIWKTLFRHKDTHHCEAAVLGCIDFRFRKAIAEFVHEGLEVKDFDLATVPGGAKTINDDHDLAHACLRVPCDLHHAKKLVLINHADCGAYGGVKHFSGDKAAEEVFHRNELIKAKTRLTEDYPDKEIITIFARLDEAHEHIEFVRVD